MRWGSLSLASVSIKNSQRQHFLLQQEFRQGPLGTPRPAAPCTRLVLPDPVGFVQTPLCSGDVVSILEKRVVLWGAAVTSECAQRAHFRIHKSMSILVLHSQPFLSVCTCEVSRV